MATRIDPPTLSSTPYELYRQELLTWEEVTDFRKKIRCGYRIIPSKGG